MTIGSTLLQPQRVRRSSGGSADAMLMDDILSLATRMIVDHPRGGQLLAVWRDAFEGMGRRIEQRCTPGLTKANARLTVLFQPTLDFVQALEPPSDDSPASGLELLNTLITKLSGFANGLTLDQLREKSVVILNILHNDLGITNTFLEDQLWGLIDDVVAAVEVIPPEMQEIDRQNRLVTASVLRRLKRRLRDEFTLPELDAEQLAKRLLELLRAPALDTFVRKAACLTAGLSDAVAAGGTLVDLVPFPGFGDAAQTKTAAGVSSMPAPATAPRSRRHSAASHAKPRGLSRAAARDLPADPPGNEASNKQYGWYASWLLGSKDGAGRSILAGLPLPWMPDAYADVWIDNGKAKKAKLFGGGEEDLLDPDTNAAYPGTIADWKSLPIFTRRTGTFYLCDRIQKDTLEKFAYHSAWSIDALRLILNLTSLEEGDWLSNTFNSAYYTGHGLFKFFGHKPLNWSLPVEKFPNSHTLWWILSRAPVTTGFGSLQDAFSNRFSYYFTLLVADGGEQYILSLVANVLRDALLSSITMINNDSPFFAPGDGTPRPANLKESDGVVGLLALVVGLVLPGPPKDDYGYPFQTNADGVPKLFLLWNLLINTCFSVLQTTAGTIGALPFSRAIDWSTFGKTLGVSAAKAFIGFYPALYLSAEGKTDDGTYNPLSAAYQGYPPAASSPYKLPYPKGKSYQCSQGNQGMWSHNAVESAKQIYAYDFAMSADDVIIASRPGTVIDFFETTDNDEVAGGDWNNIVIRHDLQEDASGNLSPLTAPLAGHDIGPNGQAMVTFGVYGHGRKGSISKVFNDRGVTAIVGAKVRRGQPIMLAGNTGNSFYNHLHIHVVGEDLPRPAPATGDPPLSKAKQGDIAVPFVFSDVSGTVEVNRFTFSPTGGVPTSMNYYTSDNEPVS